MIDLTQPFREAKNRAAEWTPDRIEEVCDAIAQLVPDAESSYFNDYCSGGVSPRVEIPGEWERDEHGRMHLQAIDWIAVVWNQGPLVVLNSKYATDSIVEQIKKNDVVLIEEDIMKDGYHMDKELLDELFPDKLQEFDPEDIALADILMYPL